MIRHKYGAVRTIRDGHSFASKKEARYYDQLVTMQRGGEVVFFLRQVPFHLPGGIKYVVDFQIFWNKGFIEFVDVKGVRTKDFIRNKKMVEALYPIKIKEV